MRRSVSSIQFSIRLAVATSLCSSQTACVARSEPRQCLIIGGQFGKHVVRRDEILVIVAQPLMPGDIADRMQRRSADLAARSAMSSVMAKI